MDAVAIPRKIGAASVSGAVPQVRALNKCKLVFIGDSVVGKTSILARYVYGTFCERYTNTIGIDFLTKTMQLKGDSTMRIQLWDTAGQERFQGLIPAYLRDASGVVIVYDVTNRASFDSAHKWIDYARLQSRDLTVLILGNKADLINARKVSPEEGAQFANEHQALFMEVSAKTGANVEECFQAIVAALPEASLLPVRDAAAGPRLSSPPSSRGGCNLEEAEPSPRRCDCWLRMMATAIGF